MPDAKKLRNQVAAALRAGRRAKGLTQEALAAEVDCAVETLSNAERAISLPSLELFFELARVLQIDVAQLSRGGADNSDFSRSRLRLVSDANSLALQMDERLLRQWIDIGKVLQAD